MVGTLNGTGHSRFAPRDELNDQQNQLNAVPEAGIGTVLSGGSGTPVRVRVVFAGSPAAATRLQPGDVLEAAEGVALEGKTLRDALARGVRGIVLDLRDDPGGYLDEAVLVASEFIPAREGTNVLIQGRRRRGRGQSWRRSIWRTGRRCCWGRRNGCCRTGARSITWG